jgi:hypothetical protein
MKVAYATKIILVFWLIDSSYWTNSQCANLHTPNVCFLSKINIQDGLQRNLWNGFEIGMLNFGLSLQQLCYSSKHCTCHIMFTSANFAATTKKLFEQKHYYIYIYIYIYIVKWSKMAC